MLLKTLIFLCSAALLVSAVTDKPVDANHAVNKDVSGTPIESNVDSKKKTTTSTTTTSTTPSTTTSTTPPTTPTTPPTTTPSTTTTTPSPTTTTPAPPVPNPKDHMWSLNGTNATCIVVQMAVQFEITYPVNKTLNMTQKINLPVDSVVTGSCDKEEQSIILSWNSTKGLNSDSFTLHFIKTEKNSKYALHHMDLVIMPQELPKYNMSSNATLKFMHVADEYPTKLGNSYRCIKESSFKMINSGSNDTSAIVKLNNVQFQAFKSEKNTSFGLAEDCAFDTPDVVPIAVGCALAALVVIVLVAYLIGRRRAAARGYTSRKSTKSGSTSESGF